MPQWIFAIIQAVTSQSGEPQFTLGNVITIVSVIVACVVFSVRLEGKIKTLAEKFDKHLKDFNKHVGDDEMVSKALNSHINDDDKHIGRRLFDMMLKRFDASDAARERVEEKIDRIEDRLARQTR